MGYRLGCPLLDRSSEVFTALGDPPDPRRTPRRLWYPSLGGLDRAVHPSLSSDARCTAARPRGPAAAIPIGRRDHPLDRRPPTREGTRDPLRRPGADPAPDGVRRLIAQAREWAESLDKPVALWLSDKQDAFVTGIAAEFPDVPPRYCDNHFLRDVAKPVLDADSHAKVQMRRKVRGLRTIEQAMLARQKAEPRDDGPDDPAATVPATAAASDLPPAVVDPAGGVVLDYCAAVRGILNDDQGGPLHPPGLRMAEALNEVQESIR